MINKGPLQPSLLSELEHLSKEQLRRLLSDHLTRRKLGLYWESDAIARDAALNANLVFPRRVEAWSHCPTPETPCPNLVIDGGVLDLRPLLGELAGQRDAEQGAALFHATLVAALAEWTARACATAGIETVALGGGCFFNRLLAAGLRRELEALGLRVLAPIKLVPGDAGLALGQAWVALHTLENR